MIQDTKRNTKLRCACTRHPLSVFQRGKGRHAVECPPCGIRTAWCDSLDEAVDRFKKQSVVSLKPIQAERVAKSR